MLKKNNLLICIILLAVLFTTFGCEKNGKLKVSNRTLYPVYLGVDDVNYTIPAGDDIKLEVKTGTQSPFDSDVGVYQEIYLSGDTYQIWDAYLNSFVEKTSVWINAGKTTNVYVNANRASIKVVNQSQQYIKRIIVQRNTLSTSITNVHDVFLAPGDEWQKPHPPSDTVNNYFYIVQVIFENDTALTYGNEQNHIYKGEQFLVNVLPPEEK
jgi:hypothetical protein